ncbi:uncharacterized protein LOC108905319 [Anoplophora glabripennis]|uniref:uncharacterized protein LOC108905319 n=1 Tax=Anoplophora glabripennis TaxID=217634 RepID=UPI0008744337|nr:uncharacterized protein LOC108905319 [Anoplophora glabripennis]
MKFVVLFSLLFLLGISQAQFNVSEENDLTLLQSDGSIQKDQGKRRVLRRAVRNAFTALGQKYSARLEKIIINNCETNGQYEIAEKLQPSFDEMKACLSKKRIFRIPRDEYLAHIEACRRESIKLSKSCLSESQRYFPDLQLDISKSLTNVLYDDFDILSNDMVKCLPKLKNKDVLTNYAQCIKEVAAARGDSSQIPDTKKKFCQSFVPLANCFTNMIKDTCGDTPGITKFGDDYIKAHKDVCEENEI